MEKFFKNIPYMIIEAILVQKYKEYPETIQIDYRYLRMLEKRLETGIPAEIAIALNMLDPLYSHGIKVRRGNPVADEELQGYLDTIALFITTWVEESTEPENPELEAFEMIQIPEYASFPQKLQRAAEACIFANLDWARKSVDPDTGPDGAHLMRHIAASLLDKAQSDLYQQGIRTAQATYLLHNDLANTFVPK